jgi:hypothetical protein
LQLAKDKQARASKPGNKEVRLAVVKLAMIVVPPQL